MILNMLNTNMTFVFNSGPRNIARIAVENVMFSIILPFLALMSDDHRSYSSLQTALQLRSVRTVLKKVYRLTSLPLNINCSLAVPIIPWMLSLVIFDIIMANGLRHEANLACHD